MSCRMCGTPFDRVGELKMPVLVVHSDEDGLFPLSMAERVAEACGEHGKLIVIRGVVAQCADLRADGGRTGSRLQIG